MIHLFAKNTTSAGTAKYTVTAGGTAISRSEDGVDVITTDYPEQAIEAWVEFQKDRPSEVYITAKDEAVFADFYEWTLQAQADIKKMVSKQKVYKVNSIMDALTPAKVAGYTYDRYDDSMSPFDVG